MNPSLAAAGQRVRQGPTGGQDRRIKSFAREVIDLSTSGDEELLTVSHLSGVTRRSEKTVYMFMADSLEGYKRVRPDDLVVNTMWAWMGALGIAREHGVVSPAYAVYRLDQAQVYPPYLELVMRSPQFVNLMARTSTGVWVSRLRLYPEDLLNLRMKLPTLDQQRRIADASGEALRDVDAVIARLDRGNNLLNERRQALINAGTSDSTLARSLLPSGAAWRELRLKYLVSMNERALPESTRTDYEFRYLDISAVGRGRLVAPPQPVTFGTAPSRARRKVKNGETIVSSVRTYLRAVWPVEDDRGDLVVSTGFAVLTPRPGVHPTYLSWLMQSDAVIEEVVRRSVGISYPAIGPWDVGEIKVRVPEPGAQEVLAMHLQRKVGELDRLVDSQVTMVATLGERKQALLARLRDQP